MGAENSKKIFIRDGIKVPGCLRIMFNKYGAAAVDLQLLRKWTRWTEGKFPSSGTLSLACLMECREIMAGKVKPFQPAIFDMWEREAREREEKQKSEETEDTKKEVTREAIASTPSAPPNHPSQTLLHPLSPRYRDLEHFWPFVVRALPQPSDPPLKEAIAVAPVATSTSQGGSSQGARAAGQGASGAAPPKPSNPEAITVDSVSSTVGESVSSTVDVKSSDVEDMGYTRPTRNRKAPECYQSDGRNGFIIQVPGPARVQTVVRPWLRDEMALVIKALPRPQDGVERFIQALDQVFVLYQPTPMEFAAILAFYTGADWLDLRATLSECLEADFNPTTKENKVTYDTSKNALFDALRLKYTKKVDWTKMAVQQGRNETAFDYMTRLTKAVSAHAGTDDAAQLTFLTRQHFLFGLREEVRAYVTEYCVTWRRCDPAVLLSYAENFEVACVKRKKKKEMELQRAALRFFQSQSGGRGAGQGRGRRGNGRGNGGSGCYECGKPGHFARDCWSKQG